MVRRVASPRGRVGSLLSSSRAASAAAAAAIRAEGVEAAGAAAAAEPPKTDEAIPYSFDKTFHVAASKAGNIYAVQEGGYVDLDAKELETYMPEGLAGEMDTEFEFSGRQTWMIRDSSKLLCRILDEFRGGAGVPGLSVHKKVVLPHLTDRPEWKSSSLSVKWFGQELMPPPLETIASTSKGKGKGRRTAMNTAIASSSSSSSSSSEATSIVSGEGSVVEKVMSELKGLASKTGSAAAKARAVPDKIVLTGARGAGKSAVLNQLVMHARKSGWLCLFVPKGWDQVQAGWYVEPVAPLRPDLPAVFDNPFMSSQVLRGTWKAHAALLRSMPMKFPAAVQKYGPFLARFKEAYDRAKSVSGRENFSFRQMREIVEAEDFFPDQDRLDAPVLDGSRFDYARAAAPKTLEDLVLLGVAFRDLAGCVFMDLVAELKEVESVPVLIAVDQYNTWEVPSAFHFNNEPVMGKQLCVPHSLQFLSKKKADSDPWTLKNGICVCSTSHAHAEGRKETYENVSSSFPLVIKVPTYTQVEFLSSMTLYMHQNLVAPGTTTQELLAFRMLSGSNPYSARKESVPFFFPISVGKLGDDILMNLGASDDEEGEGEGGEGGSKQGAEDESTDSLVDDIGKRR